MELSLIDEEFSDEDIDSFVFSSIEHYKEEDGLGGLPHEIIKSEISIDGDTWFASEKFMSSK